MNSTMYQNIAPLSPGDTMITQDVKRKRSISSAVTQSLKQRPKISGRNSSSSSPLVKILQQYGILESVVSNICASDLLALALASKALLEAIMPGKLSLENLLGRLSCSGKCIEIRNMCHQKSKYFTQKSTEYVVCGSKRPPQRSIETRPCVSCKVATCNECRIHCVYQTIYEAPSDPSDSAELPNFSGFVLLQPLEQPILSPHHLVSTERNTLPRWQDPSTCSGGPYHDQGYLEAPLQLAATGAPECIEAVIDLDLGQYPLMFVSQDSSHYTPSPVIESACMIVDERRVFLCDKCFDKDAPKGPGAVKHLNTTMSALPWLLGRPSSAPIKECHCTLRKRCLDRWLCLGCYQNEENVISDCTVLLPHKGTGMCGCGANARHTICLWCWGEVTEEHRGDSEDDPFFHWSDSTTDSEADPVDYDPDGS
jgi:hypothetical protein